MRRGFTLIELLVVIAILAVLATAVVLVLNPAQLIQQGRDSTRISDLAALQSAIALYLADVPSANLSASHYCTVGTVSPMGGTCVTRAVTAVDGTGWVDVNFNSVSSGSPLSRLPIDPVNDATYFYAFQSTTAEQYEINANMESTKYSTDVNSSVELNAHDGGDADDYYEVGSILTL